MTIEIREFPAAHWMVTLETGGSGNPTPAPAPAFGSLFSAQKPAENKDAPKPGTHEYLILWILVGVNRPSSHI